MNAIPRRTVLQAGLVAVLSACTSDKKPDTAGFVDPDGPEVRAAEAARHPGTVRPIALTATVGPVDLGGLTVTTWTYGGALPGTPIRVKAGEVIRATVTNQLPEPTTIHWHGLALRNDADGIPDITQPAIKTQTPHVYEFTAANPGTYWFHPHTGLQLDRGLYAPLIVEDPHEPLDYDDEWTVVLDDWLDGIDNRTPDAELDRLRHGMTMGRHMMGGASSYLLGGDAGDVTYPHFLLNGRIATAPATHHAKPGTRLRLRLINAAADTAFRIALGGHRLSITHTDGYPTQPVAADTLLIGMGERYDVLVTLADGVFPLIALAEGKQAAAFGLIRTATGAAPSATIRPRELNGKLATYRQLQPTEAVRLPSREPDRRIELTLTGGMMRYDWAFNAKPYDPDHIEPVHGGERVQLSFVNTTTMWHPVHLHGHTFAAGSTGLRKDTAIVLPGQTLTTTFDADNPGRWMIHCHNIYHAEAGMMTQLGYQR